MIVQLAPLASVALLHVPPLVNFAGAAGYDMLVATAVPILVTVMVCAALVCPTVTLPKASDEVDVPMLGLAPPPGRLAPWRLARRK